MRKFLTLGLCTAVLVCGSCSEEPRPTSNDVSEGTVPSPSPAPAPTREEKLTLELARARAAVEQNPQDAEAHRELADLLRIANRSRESIDHFERAVELEPVSKRRLQLAIAYTAAARLTEAVAIYETLLSDPKVRVQALHNLGNIAFRRGDTTRAIEYYRQAIAEKPDYLLAYYHLGITLEQDGDYREAFASFNKVMQLRPAANSSDRNAYLDALYRMASLDLAMGSHERAASLLTQLLELQPDHPNARHAYGRALMLLGREEEAREALTRHIKGPDRRSGAIGWLGSPWPDEPLSEEPLPLQFFDVTEAAGIFYKNHCGSHPRDKGWLSESMGAGAAWLDYDGDGILDLYLVNGSDYERGPDRGEPNQLYRGLGGGAFEDVTARAGVGHRGWGYGVAVGDMDNDGDPDIYVTNLGPNVLYRNDGDGTFTDITQAAGVGDERWGTSAAFFDMELDGDLDLYVGNYMESDPRKVPRKGESINCGFKGVDVACGPKEQPPMQDVLYRNDGNSRFTDVTVPAGISLETPRFSLGVVVADYDNDGLQDIYVANDSVQNSLWKNRGDGSFVDNGVVTMSAVNGDGVPQAGMGTDMADLNGDGWMDIVVTNFSHDLNTVYANVAGKYFTDDSSRFGMSATGMVLSWGVGFEDFDLDGDLDLFIANGHVYPEVDSAELGTPYEQANHLFVNRGDGRLIESHAEAGPGFQVVRSFRGAAFADYDEDGDVDILVTAIDDRALLLNNSAPGDRHWLQVSLEGRRSNRDGVGARVTVTSGGRRQIGERKGGGSYLSANSPRLHFGVGQAPRIDRVEVRWPSGIVDVFEDLAANQVLNVIEGEHSTGAGIASPP